MEHVRWTQRPDLQRPVLVAAFEGWNDAADAATAAARFLRDRWDSEPVADIDPEEFYDFTATRPHVRLHEGVTREIEWPENRFWAASEPREVVVLLGVEPQLRWRTYCEQIVAVARDVGAEMVVTLGALLAEVPHTRPTSVVGTCSDPDLMAEHGLRRSTYEGPTGIVGVLHDACSRAGLPSASLWAAVPAYVPGAPSPKAALALVERTASLLCAGIATTELEIAAASYDRQVSELVAGDEEMSEYVADLERRFETEDDVPSGERLIEEVERFLRNQRPSE